VAQNLVLRCARQPTRRSAMSSDDDVVCVIDDDEAIRKSLAFLLRAANVEVQTYESARYATLHQLQAGLHVVG
jgi:FixJ family two-component response regulator